MDNGHLDRKEIWITGILFLIVLIAFATRLFLVTRQPLVYGDDGPYYLAGTNAVLGNPLPSQSSQQFGSFDSLIFYYFAVFSLAFQDVALGIKVGASLLSALSVIPIFFLVRYITKSDYVALFMALLGAFSAPSLLIAGNTLKEVGGLLIGITLTYVILKSLKERLCKETLFVIVSLCILMLLTHLTSSFYFFSFLAPFLVYQVFKNKTSGKKDNMKKTIAGNALCILVLMSIVCLCALVFYQFSGRNATEILNYFKFPSLNAVNINLEMFLYYLPLVPFILFFLYALATSRDRAKQDITYVSLLLIWLVIGFVLTQTMFANKWWAERFELMNYPVMIILSSLGFSATLTAFARRRGLVFVIASLVIALEFVFFYSIGGIVSPSITSGEYDFFIKMKNELPQNTVVLEALKPLGEYQGPWVKHWLSWVGFKIKSEKDLTSGDMPLVLLEVSTNCSSTELYRDMAREGVVGSSGRFFFVRYPLASPALLDRCFFYAQV